MFEQYLFSKIIKIITAKNGNNYAITENKKSVLATAEMEVGGYLNIFTDEYLTSEKYAAEKAAAEAERAAEYAAARAAKIPQIKEYLTKNQIDGYYVIRLCGEYRQWDEAGEYLIPATPENKEKIIDECVYDEGEDALDDFANGEPFDDDWLKEIGAIWRKKQD